tara:strand:+ start:1054 stop:1194 length:141 start_codon:yes stop_codon:yes gene_type:complete
LHYHQDFLGEDLQEVYYQFHLDLDLLDKFLDHLQWLLHLQMHHLLL